MKLFLVTLVSTNDEIGRTTFTLRADSIAQVRRMCRQSTVKQVVSIIECR